MFANRHLLKRAKKSQTKQLKELLSKGIKINRTTITRLTNGKFRTIYFNILIYFQMYWGIPLNDLYEIGLKIMRGEEVE